MPDNPNPFGPVVSSTVTALVLLTLITALGTILLGIRDSIIGDWADDVPDPLDELDTMLDEPDAEPRRVFRFEGEAARRWLEAHGYPFPGGLVWPPAEPEPWRPNPPEDVRP